jgi:hypothetical protein
MKRETIGAWSSNGQSPQIQLNRRILLALIAVPRAGCAQQRLAKGYLESLKGTRRPNYLYATQRAMATYIATHTKPD